MNRLKKASVEECRSIKKINIKIKYLGENGFTFQFFQRLADEPKFEEYFFKQIKLSDNSKISLEKNERIKEIYLFPNFGKKFGLGEPDAILITSENSLFFVEVEISIDPKKWYNVTKILREMLAENNIDKEKLYEAFKKYKATPLYQMERFYMIGQGLIKHEDEGKDHKKRFCSILPSGDQISPQNNHIRNCLLRGKNDIQRILKNRNSDDPYKFYVILFSINARGTSPYKFISDALVELEGIWNLYKKKYNDNKIQYTKPSEIIRKTDEIVNAVVNNNFDINKFGRFFYRDSIFGLYNKEKAYELFSTDEKYD